MESTGDGEKNQDGFHFEFPFNSNLGLAIHGTTNIRLHCVQYQKTYFRIYDIYDFNQRDLVLARLNQDSSTPGVDYRIIIEGLQIGMNIQ